MTAASRNDLSPPLRVVTERLALKRIDFIADDASYSHAESLDKGRTLILYLVCTAGVSMRIETKRKCSDRRMAGWASTRIETQPCKPLRLRVDRRRGDAAS